MKLYNEYILHRHPENPILSPADFPNASQVFNCGQVVYQGKPLLLVSIGHRSGKYRGTSGMTTHVARSDDGVHFAIDPEPFLQCPEQAPYRDFDFSPIDTRVTELEGEYYIVHPGCGPWGTFGILGKTRDFSKHEYVEVISLPDNRVPCLFPERIGGKYFRLDRPYRVAPNNNHVMGNIWVSSSPDLVHWGCHRPLLKPGYAPWARAKIGPVPPIRTHAGWLTLIHGVAQSCTGHRYSLGAVLLDLEDPTKIVGKTLSSILEPCEPHETMGVVPNVVFACGALAFPERDEIRVYYGGADTTVNLATGSLEELVQACLHER